MCVRFSLAVLILVVGFFGTRTQADIYRWDTGEVIPGTEGVTPGPGVQLDHRELGYALIEGASLDSLDLTGANFEASDLAQAKLWGLRLTNANFSGANLSNAELGSSTLTEANLSGAVATGAIFLDTTSRGFTEAQLASTASYQAKNLMGIHLAYNDLTGWDLSGQNLTSAQLFQSTLTQANLSGAVVTGASFWDTTSQGFTQEQLASTASYQARNLQGIGLSGNNLSGWDFSGQNLSNASLSSSRLTQANLSGANLSNANLNSSTLTNANLSGANLSNASLDGSTLTNANLSGANLKNANLNEAAAVQSAVFASSTIYNQWTVFPAGFDPITSGLTLMPSSTGDFDANDALDLADTDLLQFMIRNGYANAFWLPTTMFDLNSDGEIDLEDVGVWVKDLKHTWFGDANLDGEFNSTDLIMVFQAGRYEVPSERRFGILINPATWSAGDWDADGEFNSSDLIVALADGGYEQGPRATVATVPEPSSVLLLGLGIACINMRRRVLQTILRNA